MIGIRGVTCFKCQGLMVTGRVIDEHDTLTCLNCGKMEGMEEMSKTIPDNIQCGKNTCNDKKDPNSVFCNKHFKQKRADNERHKAKRAADINEKIKRSQGGYSPKGSVNPTHPPTFKEENGNKAISAISDINRAIIDLQKKIDVLVYAKEVLMEVQA